VVFVATSNDSLYAVDANTGQRLWTRSFLSSGVTAVNLSNVGVETMGILSTPVIDPGTRTMYVVVWTAENNDSYFPHRLHAIDITTGLDKVTAVTITDSAMQPLYQLQRSALLLVNGTIYAGFGSVGDITPYHGLVFAFDEATLVQKAKWNVTPGGMGGGVWMSGAAPTADSSGNVYLSIGNGHFDGSSNFGESAVKLSPSLTVLDYFTPYNYNSLNTNDVDLGSGSVVVVPDQPGAYKHELIACGKPTPIYVLNRDNMGKLGTSADNVIQRLDNAIGGTGNVPDSGQPCYNSPAVWNNNVYFAANDDVLKMFTISPTTGQLSLASNGATTYAWPGTDPVVSSNGTTNGIVWTVDSGTATLHANDATDVSKSLYVGPSMGSVHRWVPPTVVNGWVYVAASNWLVGYSNK
jgi:outer membrane protein assembly factor BamB